MPPLDHGGAQVVFGVVHEADPPREQTQWRNIPECHILAANRHLLL